MFLNTQKKLCSFDNTKISINFKQSIIILKVGFYRNTIYPHQQYSQTEEITRCKIVVLRGSVV